ncbi:uncharacterized protein LOC132606395 isoform X3 [Lycium barbarum]|uniref:uncharacterized protein LOC132606395 isoform X3 n=1 Tax=Lycium barbarum TaxID=112863 RepID=UPI00293F3851|nr:uncharacterized protein LOC132606395 isoform X3 [Lycium barbarum]
MMEVPWRSSRRSFNLARFTFLFFTLEHQKLVLFWDFKVERKRVQRSVVSVVAFLCRWEQIDRVCNTSWTQWGGASILNWGYSLLPTSLPLYCGWPVLVAATIALLISRTSHTIWSLKISLLEDSNMMKSWEH